MILMIPVALFGWGFVKLFLFLSVLIVRLMLHVENDWD